MKEVEYAFSVVMAVYNTKPFLKTAIESIINQTIGFNKIQLILVDDGSTDGSGEICDRYASKYPKNIVVVHKPNGGVSSARNQGLPYVRGRILNFLDSDDKISQDAFEKVFMFFEKNGDKTDVVTIPMKFFDAVNGDHPQNAKFEIGKDIVDLNEIPNIINMSVASFIDVNAAKGLLFDERLKYGEDSKYILSVLMKKMTLGLVKDATYWYRKRSVGESSAGQSAVYKKEWYGDTIRFFSLGLMDISERLFGKIPEFIQYQVMYDFQWRWRQNHIPAGVLSEAEEKQYFALLVAATKKIEDAVIMQQNALSDGYKTHILINKYGRFPEIRKTYSEPHYSDNNDVSIQSGDIVLSFSSTANISVAGMRTVLDFLTIDKSTGSLTIEGYQEISGINEETIKPALLVNNKVYYCDIINREMNHLKSLNKMIGRIVGFKAVIPSREKNMSIIPAVIIDNVLVIKTTIKFGDFFPVCSVYKNAYALACDKVVTVRENSIQITEKPNWFGLEKIEYNYLHEIWNKNYLGGRKAIAARLYCHLVKPFKRRALWIVSDRVNKADDNGEAIFRYIMQNKPANTRVVFAISKTSQDYERLSKIGECVDAMSLRHKLLYLLSDIIISSHTDEVFKGYNYPYRDLLWGKKYVFLPHGVTKEDISSYLNRYRQNFSGFVTTSAMERDSILNGDYGYSEDKVWLTGHPRYDYLYHAEKKVITILPTWRKYLFKSFDNKTGLWDAKDNFEKEEYFKFYNALINSERLLSGLAEYGYILQFFPHPNVQRYINRFTKKPEVNFLPIDTIYRDVLAESKLVITDYSAAVFDFGYLRKPIIYCQFDRDKYFSDHLAPGYYNYERDGFGEVVYDLDSTIDLILDYVKNDCVLKEKYEKRINDFFAYADNNSCKRVLDKIQSL